MNIDLKKDVAPILIGLFTFTILSFGYFGIPSLLMGESQSAEVVPGSGYVIYGDGTELSIAPFTTTGNQGAVFGALASVTVGTISPLWVKTESAPTRKVSLSANMNTSGVLELLRSVNGGTTWTLDWTENGVGSASLDTRAYDLAFESGNGSEAVVAWAKNKGQAGAAGSTTGDDALEYRVWNGTSWGASQSYDMSVAGFAASISWIEMWSHPASGSNQSDIVLCYATQGRYGSAAGTTTGCLVWDGTNNQWGNEKILSRNAEEEAAISGSSKAMGGFYEQGSGDFIGITTKDGVAAINYATWTSSWTATSSYTWLDIPATINCAAMPWVVGVTNNQAICGSHDSVANDQEATDWTGSAFGTATDVNATALTTAITARLSEGATWLINGSSQRVGLLAWPETAGSQGVPTHRWDEVGAAWATGTGPTTNASTLLNFAWNSNPDQRNKGILLIHDSASDLQVYKASISGSATPLWGTMHARLTADMASAGLTGMSAAASYFNYASPTMTHFRWYSDDAAPGSATQISAEDIPASGSEELMIDTSYRLRLQVSNEGPASASKGIFNDNYKLEFTRENTTTGINGCANPATGWSWRTIPISASVASDAFDLEDSSSFTSGASISAATLTASDPTFINGYALDSKASTGFQILGGNNYSEFEFNLKPNSNANTNASYCFRLSRWQGNITPLTIASMSYSVYASAGIQAAGVATFTQNNYKWFSNDDSVQPIDNIGSDNSAVNLPENSTTVRLRMTLLIGTSTWAALSSSKFNLQFAGSTSGPWINVGAIASTSQVWRFYNNPSPADDADITVNLITGSDVLGTYEEINPTATNPRSATVGQDVEFDFSLDTTNVSPGSTYYFRLVNSSDGSSLNGYTRYPTISKRSNGVGGGGNASDGNSGGGTGQSGGLQNGGGGASGNGGGDSGQSGGGAGQSGGGPGGSGGGSPIIWYYPDGWLIR